MISETNSALTESKSWTGFAPHTPFLCLPLNTIRLAVIFAGVHALMLTSLACAQSPITDRLIDAEVSTPLYSSSRPAAVILKRRAQIEETNDVVSAQRASLIDETTRWQFVSRESISIHSDLIRLADVVRPLETNLAAWPRLSETTIGLMPVDGSVAKISRDRLAHLIAGGKATPEKIKIYGPETIVVQRAKPDTGSLTSQTSKHETHYRDQTQRQASNVVSNASYDEADAKHSDVQQATAVVTIDPVTRDRLEQWVRVGVRNKYKELHNAFEYDIVFDASELGTLEKIQGIRQMTFLNSPPVWSHEGVDPVTCRVQLHGRAGIEDCEGVVQITFRSHPAVVTARRSLRRGHRVTTGDLRFEPFAGAGASLPEDVVESPGELVGLEVTGLVRSGIALSRGMFAAPRVVRRGDLLEVQVGGGGVRVTTSAKALADGAKGELIEIETLQPKRRLLAKVVNSSLVEVITQAPRVTSQSRPNR